VVAPSEGVVGDADAGWRYACLLARLDAFGFGRFNKTSLAYLVVSLWTRVHDTGVHIVGHFLLVLAARGEVVAALRVDVVRNADALHIIRA